MVVTGKGSPGSYTLGPLPSGYVYNHVTHDSSNKCQCSTVGYSLISACEACQGQYPNPWFSHVSNCTYILPPSQFPNPVPVGIYVPHWAILDVTNENNWNPNKSYAVGDNPEYGPGAIFGALSVYTPSASASASSTASSTHSHSGGHAGAIAGGVIGGIAIIFIAAAAIFYLRWRRSQATSALEGVGASQPMLNYEMVAQPSSGSPLTMKFYNPDDPSTFPGYQRGPQSVDIPSASQVPLSSRVGSISTLADVQTSLSHASGYRGLPMPSA